MPSHAPGVHVQVLWHTAVAFSKNLVLAAQLPAKELSEQTTELVAERRRKQHHAILVPAQSEPNAGPETFHVSCTLPLAWSWGLALLATTLGKWVNRCNNVKSRAGSRHVSVLSQSLQRWAAAGLLLPGVRITLKRYRTSDRSMTQRRH